MSRKTSIDVLRALGALAVVALHTMIIPVNCYTGTLSETVRFNLKSVEILMGWVVPVFLMISGYCLSNKKECSYKYCFSHIIKFVEVLFTFGLFFSLLEEVYAAKTAGLPIFSASLIGRALLNVINGNLWDHMWFVYVIIGIYMVMPVIHAFMQTGSRNIYTLTLLLFVFAIFIPELNQGTGLNINVSFPFAAYLFYVCFGGLVRNCEIKKWFFYTVVALGVISAIYMTLVHTEIGRYSDKSPFVAIWAMAVFLIFDRINFKENKLVYEIAASTWGIYLIHPLFLNLGIKLLKIDVLTTMPYLKLTATWLVVFLLSFGTVWILRRLPLFKKIL